MRRVAETVYKDRIQAAGSGSRFDAGADGLKIKSPYARTSNLLLCWKLLPMTIALLALPLSESACGTEGLERPTPLPGSSIPLLPVALAFSALASTPSLSHYSSGLGLRLAANPVTSSFAVAGTK